MRTITLDDFYTCRETVDQLLEAFPAPGTYFDVSAGDGYVGSALSARGWEVVGQVDLAPRGDAVARRDFFRVPPVPVTLVGFNPPFGRQGVLAKKFVRAVAEEWCPAYMAFILPRRFRGTTRVEGYELVEERPVRDFYRPETGRRRKIPSRFVLLRRAEGATAFLSRAPVVDLRVPAGVTLFPRSKQVGDDVNLLLRAQGGGCDALVRVGGVWECMRAGRWIGSYVHPREAGWVITVRAKGCDWCMLRMAWDAAETRAFVEAWAATDDPLGATCRPPSRRRTWLCALLRQWSSSRSRCADAAASAPRAEASPRGGGSGQ